MLGCLDAWVFACLVRRELRFTDICWILGQNLGQPGAVCGGLGQNLGSLGRPVAAWGNELPESWQPGAPCGGLGQRVAGE